MGLRNSPWEGRRAASIKLRGWGSSLGCDKWAWRRGIAGDLSPRPKRKLGGQFCSVISYFFYTYTYYTLCIYIFLLEILGIQLNTHASIAGPPLTGWIQDCRTASVQVGEEKLRAKALTGTPVDMTAAPLGVVSPLGASRRSSNPPARASLGENPVQFLDE